MVMNEQLAFDYVIVGGGSAGCALASRLSEDREVTVCLIEAGAKDTSAAIHIPIGLLWLMRSPTLNWNLQTQPEPELNDRSLFWPRGKVLGGSSSSNAMCYTRGHMSDYDAWQAEGCHGWSFNEVLPYFKRAENQERGASDFHGTGGPLNVADLRFRSPVCQSFIDAAVQAGIPANEDFNGLQQEGVGFFQVTQKDGARCSAAKGYLRPVRPRPNLTVMTDMHVRQVLFGKGHALPSRATGVQGIDMKSHAETRVHARKEVILCAGAIGSPQLLMQSGIGEQKMLQKLGIPCIHDLPGVGRNLQDHLDIMVVHQTSKKVGYHLGLKSLALWPLEALNYCLNRQGMLTTNGAEAGGFISSSPDQPRPDLQLHFTPAKLRDHGRDLGFMAAPGFSLHVCNLRPKSRGQIRIVPTALGFATAIQPRYLSHEDDVLSLVKGIKLARGILSQAALAPYGGAEVSPGPKVTSDEAIQDHVRSHAESIYHPVGTCKMGLDEMAVVDPELRVFGVEALRVVDASIMPTIVGGNTNAPTIMIAEKAADLIKRDAWMSGRLPNGDRQTADKAR